MSDPRLDPDSLAWGLSLGITFGMWLRGTLDALFLRPRQMTPPRQPSFAELLMPPPRDRDPDWRRSFTHENTSRPSGPPPLKFRRSSDGYQPRPQQGTPNPPPSEP
ncbi:MAG: hypothetical protein RJA63_2228 [Pseudomonadota bacterium]|jgi:hypothetical protein